MGRLQVGSVPSGPGRLCCSSPTLHHCCDVDHIHNAVYDDRSGGEVPRAFTLATATTGGDGSETFVLCANMDSHNVCSFKVESKTGRLVLQPGTRPSPAHSHPPTQAHRQRAPLLQGLRKSLVGI